MTTYLDHIFVACWGLKSFENSFGGVTLDVFSVGDDLKVLTVVVVVVVVAIVVGLPERRDARLHRRRNRRRSGWVGGWRRRTSCNLSHIFRSKLPFSKPFLPELNNPPIPDRLNNYDVIIMSHNNESYRAFLEQFFLHLICRTLHKGDRRPAASPRRLAPFSTHESP